MPTSSDTPKKATPTPTAIMAIVRTTRSSSWASGLRGRSPTWRQLGDARPAASLRRWLPRPPGLPLRPRRCRRTASSRSAAGDRARSRRSAVDVSTAQRVRLGHSQVGRDPVAGGEQHDVADDQLGGVDLHRRPVAHDGGAARQQVAQPLGGVLGPVLLDEREHAVDDDDDEDRDAQLRACRRRTPGRPRPTA